MQPGHRVGQFLTLALLILSIILGHSGLESFIYSYATLAYFAFFVILIQSIIIKPKRIEAFTKGTDLYLSHEAFRRYHVYIRTPVYAVGVSSLLNYLRFTSVILGVISLIQSYPILGTALLAYYPIVSIMVMRLNPIGFLAIAVNKGDAHASQEYLFIMNHLKEHSGNHSWHDIDNE